MGLGTQHLNLGDAPADLSIAFKLPKKYVLYALEYFDEFGKDGESVSDFAGRHLCEASVQWKERELLKASEVERQSAMADLDSDLNADAGTLSSEMRALLGL